jgi:large subunit ribosomal protein L24
MKNKNIKKGVRIKVICGQDKGKEGVILSRLKKDKERVLVSGVKIAIKHIKPKGNEPGKIIKQEMPIHISNLKVLE